jgi:hypothetical protein
MPAAAAAATDAAGRRIFNVESRNEIESINYMSISCDSSTTSFVSRNVSDASSTRQDPSVHVCIAVDIKRGWRTRVAGDLPFPTRLPISVRRSMRQMGSMLCPDNTRVHPSIFPSIVPYNEI